MRKIKNYKDPDEVKKSGIANRLKRIASALEDKGTKSHTAVKGIENGIGIAQDIAGKNNYIAQWLGMPQVPKPFLKKVV